MASPARLIRVAPVSPQPKEAWFDVQTAGSDDTPDPSENVCSDIISVAFGEVYDGEEAMERLQVRVPWLTIALLWLTVIPTLADTGSDIAVTVQWLRSSDSQLQQYGRVSVVMLLASRVPQSMFFFALECKLRPSNKAKLFSRDAGFHPMLGLLLSITDLRLIVHSILDSCRLCRADGSPEPRDIQRPVERGGEAVFLSGYSAVVYMKLLELLSESVWQLGLQVYVAADQLINERSGSVPPLESASIALSLLAVAYGISELYFGLESNVRRIIVTVYLMLCTAARFALHAFLFLEFGSGIGVLVLSGLLLRMLASAHRYWSGVGRIVQVTRNTATLYAQCVLSFVLDSFFCYLLPLGTHSTPRDAGEHRVESVLFLTLYGPTNRPTVADKMCSPHALFNTAVHLSELAAGVCALLVFRSDVQVREVLLLVVAPVGVAYLVCFPVLLKGLGMERAIALRDWVVYDNLVGRVEHVSGSKAVVRFADNKVRCLSKKLLDYATDEQIMSTIVIQIGEGSVVEFVHTPELPDVEGRDEMNNGQVAVVVDMDYHASQVRVKTLEFVFDGSRPIFNTPGDELPLSAWVHTIRLRITNRCSLIRLFSECRGLEWGRNENWCSEEPLSEWSGVCSNQRECTELNLSCNGLVGDVCNQLSELHHLEALDVSENSAELNVDVCALTELPALQKVCMWGVTQQGEPSHGVRQAQDLGALCKLYESTDGCRSWESSSRVNWCSDSAVETWAGVEVNSRGLVVGLDLSGAGLKGPLSALAGATQLAKLNLQHNVGLRGFTSSLLDLHGLRSAALWGTQLVSDCDSLVLQGAVDVGALVHFFAATKGMMWATADGWCSDQNVGEWHGVCTEGGAVSAIDLSGNLLEGDVMCALEGFCEVAPAAVASIHSMAVQPLIGLVSSLTKLRLARNKLSGDLSALSVLTHLEELDLGYNDLIGDVGVLAELRKCKSIVLRFNRLSGDVAQLGNLCSLTELDIGEQRGIKEKLCGNVDGLARLTLLRELSLESVEFTGNRLLSGDANKLVTLTSLSTLKLMNTNVHGATSIRLLKELQASELEVLHA